MKENKSLVKRIMAALAAGTILIAVPMSGCNSNNNNEKKDNGITDSIVYSKSRRCQIHLRRF